MQNSPIQRISGGESKRPALASNLRKGMHLSTPLWSRILFSTKYRLLFNDIGPILGQWWVMFGPHGVQQVGCLPHPSHCPSRPVPLIPRHTCQALHPYSVYPASLVERKSLAETEHRRQAPLTESEMMAQAIQRARGNPRLEAIIEKWERALMATHDPVPPPPPPHVPIITSSVRAPTP